jgi:hypothetical protein
LWRDFFIISIGIFSIAANAEIISELPLLNSTHHYYICAKFQPFFLIHLALAVEQLAMALNHLALALGQLALAVVQIGKSFIRLALLFSSQHIPIERTLTPINKIMTT